MVTPIPPPPPGTGTCPRVPVRREIRRSASFVLGLLTAALSASAAGAAAQSLPTLSISSPTVAEGRRGEKTAAMTFTVSLSAASAETVTVDYAPAGANVATRML